MHSICVYQRTDACLIAEVTIPLNAANHTEYESSFSQKSG